MAEHTRRRHGPRVAQPRREHHRPPAGNLLRPRAPGLCGSRGQGIHSGILGLPLLADSQPRRGELHDRFEFAPIGAQQDRNRGSDGQCLELDRLVFAALDLGVAHERSVGHAYHGEPRCGADRNVRPGDAVGTHHFQLYLAERDPHPRNASRYAELAAAESELCVALRGVTEHQH